MGGLHALQSRISMTHPQHLLDGFHAAPEQVHVELLEARASDGRVEIDALVQRIDLNRCLRGN